jgi:imidazolonepropionase-like amidohydrolase
MTFPVSVAFYWPKIIEIEKKYNRKMQVSPYILAGWLIDGTAGPVRKKVVLKTRGRRIVEIWDATAKDFAREDLLDLSNYTLLPGLVDCHVHLSMSGSADPSVREHQLIASLSDATQMICKHLSRSRHQGVLALRDGGDCRSHVLQYKRKFLEGKEEPPEVKTPGRAWHAPGRYGRLVGRSPYRKRSLAQSIAAGQKHVDHVKIVNSGLNSLLDFGKETSPQFPLEDLKNAVLCAHKRGLKVMVHANGRKPVQDAIDSGCNSIEHGFFMGTENLKRLAEKQITWVPTVFTMEAYARTLPKGTREAQVARKNLEHQLEQIRQAKDFGVRIAIGTDAGSLGVHHGEAVREEIGLFLVAGLSLVEAVQSATSLGAGLLGLGDRAGCLTPGSPATFLALRGKPERLLDALHSPERVYFKGTPISSLSSAWRRES